MVKRKNFLIIILSIFIIPLIFILSSCNFSGKNDDDSNDHPFITSTKDKTSPSGKSTTTKEDDDEYYNITITQSTGGRISASKAKAVEGEEIYLSYNGNDNYSFDCFIVKDSSNNDIEVSNNIFIMPKGNVVISGRFIARSNEKYEIEIEQPELGFIIYDARTEGDLVNAGLKVTLYCEINNSFYYQLDHYIVTGADGTNINVNNNNYFIMPNQNVTISAVITEIKYNITIDQNILDKCDITIQDNITKAKYNDLIYLNCEAKPGYEFVKWQIRDKDGFITESTYSDFHFYVRNSDVTISCTINAKSYYIQTENNYNVSEFYITNKDNQRTSSVSTGEEINIICTPIDGYKIKSLKYYMYKTVSVNSQITKYGDIDINTKKFVIPAINNVAYIKITVETEVIEDELSITYLDEDEETIIDNLSPTSFKNTDDPFDLPTTEKEGYRFLGWYRKIIYNDEAFYEPAEYVYPYVGIEDLVFVAKWSKAYKITYHLGEMEDVDGYVITNNNPKDFTKEDDFTFENATQAGAEFKGWYKDSNFDDNSKVESVTDLYNLTSETDEVIIEDVELYAKWNYYRYIITSNLDGGVGWSTASYTVLGNVELESFGVPTKKGYEFKGWFKESGFVNQINQIPAGTVGNFEVFAKFEIINYTITYNLFDGSVSGNPDTYNVNTETITLNNASKNGYSFVGWYTDEEFNERITTINKGSTGNKVLYALFNDVNSYFIYAGHKIIGLTDLGKTQTDIVIPSEIDGFTITTLADSCFNSSTFKTLTIPDSVVNILNGIVLGNKNLETVTFTGTPTITKIAYGAFNGCSKLKTINLPDTIEEIDNYVFSGCVLLELNGLPSALRKIGYNAFNRCQKITISELPSNVGEVGNDAFYGCIAIENIILPSSMRYNNLGSDIFKDCTGLKTLTINFSRKIPNGMFSGCTSLEAVTITNEVEEIGKEAFKNCTNLTTVTIQNPTYIYTIGENCFYNCLKLELDINFRNIKTIGNGAFNGCEKITASNKTLMNKIETIGDNAFRGCLLIDFVIPTTIKSIGDYAFYGCIAQKDASIGSNVTYLGDYAFYGNTSLPSVTINSNNITSIPSYIFNGCTSLETVTISSSNNIQTIGGYAFYSCTNLTSFDFNKLTNLTSIGSYSFAESGIVEVNLLNSQITTIKSYTFYNCTSLERVSTKYMLKTIEAYAFYGCTSLVYFDTMSGSGSGDWDYTYKGPEGNISGFFRMIYNPTPSTQQCFAECVARDYPKCVYTRV